jgi:ABC-2 type transport system ATP-binding protein
MTAHAPVDIRGLRSGYGGVDVLSGIDLVVESGARLVLLGPNGAGKTTLLRCLLGLLRPVGGSVRLWGLDPANPTLRRDLLRRVGASLESPVLPAHVRALEWMEHHATLSGLPAPRKAAREVLRSWDLPEDVDADKLSQGQRQRLLVARCLLHRPELLVLDEPAAHLDPSAREEFWAHMESWRRATGAALLVSSHQLEEAVDRGGEWIVMGAGRILHRGPAEMFVDAFPGSRRLRLDAPRHLAEIRQILSPSGCSAESAGTDPSREFRLRPNKDSPDHPGILRSLVEAGVGVTSLGEDSTSLREAYRTCLGELPAPDPGSRPAPLESHPLLPRSTVSDILSSARLHGRGLLRERRLLLPFAILLVLLCGGILLAFPAGAPPWDVSAFLAMAAILPCGLAAGLAADLVAGERERKSLETQFTLPTAFGRILAGGTMSIAILGQISSTVAVFAIAAALLRTGNVPSGAPTAAIVLGFAPAALSLSIAIGILFSLRATSARAAAQFSTLSTLPLLVLSQALPHLFPGAVLPWIGGAAGLASLAALLSWKVSRSLSPERLFR